MLVSSPVVSPRHGGILEYCMYDADVGVAAMRGGRSGLGDKVFCTLIQCARSGSGAGGTPR